MHSRAHQQQVPGSHCCILDILHVQKVAVVPEVAVQCGAVAYESHIELHTGRTHQVSLLTYAFIRLFTQSLRQSLYMCASLDQVHRS